MNTVSITIYESRFRPFSAPLRRLLLSALSELHHTHFSVEVALVPSSVMNTNVLSYGSPSSFLFGSSEKKNLGDIYLNPDYILAHQEDISHMAIHGLLHLLGYEHENEKDAKEMETLEKKLL